MTEEIVESQDSSSLSCCPSNKNINDNSSLSKCGGARTYNHLFEPYDSEFILNSDT